ncbi:Crystal protein ET79 [Burkholderia sp. Se-20373]|uniref:aegerolysin family protein n=1 Tax=Burkholderia sp. Se-20373 TaxID=2703898 RepID=UPI00198095FD|nr:aegerolysin family protein [Burkholderia sp. Se-20373]MBN3746603.1 Crystal protein ET79 [Burkholderia sp. Se-20373]
MSARSTVVKLQNNSGSTLFLDSASINLLHGEWKTYPPEKIPNGQAGEWESDSDGFMTGTEGKLQYQFADGGGIENLRLYWDNPYYGSNGYSITVSAAGYKVGYDGGSGDNATVTFYIKQV